jgi:predicted RNA-binding protein YlxR (DUF448 family)
VTEVRTIAQRSCIACHHKDSKGTLSRIVRRPDGTVTFDPTGRASGRGAYICSDEACLSTALKTNKLARALRTEIDDTGCEALRCMFAEWEGVTAHGGN